MEIKTYLIEVREEPENFRLTAEMVHKALMEKYPEADFGVAELGG